VGSNPTPSAIAEFPWMIGFLRCHDGEWRIAPEPLLDPKPRISSFYGIVITMYRLVRQWAAVHREELHDNWDRARQH
jgi:hypothetical protein